jgi:hypothetical protein
MGLHQTKELLQAKETFIRVRRLPTDWEKILSSYSCAKGLIYTIYRKLKKLNPPKTYIPTKKWAYE